MDSSSLPTDPAERAAWLDAREDACAALVRTGLRRVVEQAQGRYLGTLTAAGDLAAWDSIPGAWLTFVQTQLVDELGTTYLAGHMTAFVGLKVEPTAEFAARFAAVANEAAVSYLQDATNRLAGVGDRTWKTIRAQVSDAVEKGVSNEELKTRIENIVAMSEQRADTIARTETVGAYVQGDMAGARALGDRGPVDKVWVATLDIRTRDSHAEAHDQCVPLAEPFNVGGVQMDSPHDPNAPAAEVVNCRCYVELLYPGDTRPDGSVVEGPDDGEQVPAALTAPEDRDLDTLMTAGWNG
jgi:hypothetical protein